MMNYISGAVVAVGTVSFALTVFKDMDSSMIFNIDAFLIVTGGTVVAVFVGFPLERIRLAMRNIRHAYLKRQDRETVISDIIDISRMYRRTSIRNLELKTQSVDNAFLKFGVKLLINNYEPRAIQNIMEREIMNRMVQHSFSRNLLKTVARLTPSFGLAGTVISLIKMFRQLESVEAVAPMMAVALMSTFYGVTIANLIILPLCAKLKEDAIESEAVMHIIMEGIIAMSNMEQPLRIEERLKGCSREEIPWLEDIAGRVNAAKAPGFV